MKSLELFSGAGGLAKGLELSGFEHTAFVEHNSHACRTLRENFDSSLVFEGNVKDYSFKKLKEIDLVAGGPPCQPFSLGGKHKAHNDNRDMFPCAIQAISELKPKAFLFENVKGLLRSSFQEYFDYIILRLTFPDCVTNGNVNWQEHLASLRKISFNRHQGAKYDVQFKLINAADYGVPQTRERVIIVGTRSDLECDWTFPVPTHSKERLLWDQNISGEYWKRHGLEKPDAFPSPHIISCELFAPPLLPWQTVRDALKGVPDPTFPNNLGDHEYRNGARIYQGHTGSFIDWPSKTIKAGGHGVPGGENMIRFKDNSVRYLTVHEAKLIQAFPNDYLITGGWGEALRQIGNAVPVRLAHILGHHLIKTLNVYREKSTSRKAI